MPKQIGPLRQKYLECKAAFEAAMLAWTKADGQRRLTKAETEQFRQAEAKALQERRAAFDAWVVSGETEEEDFHNFTSTAPTE